MIHIEKLKNGLTVIIEPINHFASVSYELHLPGGLISDNEQTFGNCLVLPELTERGVEGYSSRQLSDAFDLLGARHGSSCSTDRFVYRGICLSDVFEQAFSLTTLQVLKPTLDQSEIPGIVELLKLDAVSLEDSPSRMASSELSKNFLPAPFNRQPYINPSNTEFLNAANCKKILTSYFKPSNAILSVAGKVDVQKVMTAARELLEGWQGTPPSEPKFTGVNPPFKSHIEKDTAQLQICLAYPSVKFNEPLYYTAKVCNEILSGGMFGRLFIEVREKRGLCYSVYSRHVGGKHSGSVLCYSGTTPERASETLSVMVDTVKNVKGTITKEELDRAKVNLKSSLIIGDESATSRAGSNASDYWLIQRVRTLDEISKAIDQVTSSDIDNYIEQYAPDNYSLVTLGSKKIF